MKTSNEKILWNWKNGLFAAVFTLTLQGCIDPGSAGLTKQDIIDQRRAAKSSGGQTGNQTPTGKTPTGVNQAQAEALQYHAELDQIVARNYESQMSASDALGRYTADLRQLASKYPKLVVVLDGNLTKKILLVAGNINPKPIVPSEANDWAAKAADAFKSAQIAGDYSQAAQAWQQAILLAPWMPVYYYNLGLSLEKAGVNTAFLGYKLYLAAAPDAPDVAVVARHSKKLEFAYYLARLKQNPSDGDARTNIFLIAPTLDPAPTPPSDLDVLIGKAKAAMQNATSKADYVNAAVAFDQACADAPWIADLYNNQAVAWEHAGQPNDAITCYNWYLIAAPNDPAAPQIREHIGELQYAKEKADKFQTVLNSLSVAKWIHTNRNPFGDVIQTSWGGLANGILYFYDHKGVPDIYGKVTPDLDVVIDTEVLARSRWPDSHAATKVKISNDFLSITETDTWSDGSIHEIIYNRWVIALPGGSVMP